MRISLVVAVSENGVIGKCGGIPWHLPDDQAFFKRLTSGHCVLMGRGTFESIGRPLPRRSNIVISRNPEYERADAIVVRDLDAALASARSQGEEEAFVVGGAVIYELALPRADRLYLTRVHADVPGDVFFPDIADDRFGHWSLAEETRHPADERHAHPFTFQRWERADSSTP